MLVLGWFGVCSVSISSCWNVNLVLVWCFLQVVSGAGHLRRTPLLSVFDITHYTKNNIIDEGGWGGVGWRGIIASLAIRSHALAHIRHATPLYVLMHSHTYVMLRCCTFSCTCTHTSCYAAVRSHALAHIRHAALLYVLMRLHTYVMLRYATLLYVLMHLHTYVMLRCCTFSCTCTHTTCYAAVRSHAFAHICHATPLYVLMHLHTYVMPRCCTFSCTCTHTSCYAAVRSHDDDDNDEIAPDAKVSFFSVLWSPCKMF